MWTVRIIVVFWRQERSPLPYDLVHLVASAASYIWVFPPLASFSAFRCTSTCWTLDPQIQMPGDRCQLLGLKCSFWLPCDFLLCPQTALVPFGGLKYCHHPAIIPNFSIGNLPIPFCHSFHFQIFLFPVLPMAMSLYAPCLLVTALCHKWFCSF